MNQNQPQLPNGFCILETQVAGHLFSSAALGMLKNNGYVLKPFGKPECGARELNFYECVEKAEEDEVLKKLQQFIPRFHRKVRLTVNQKEHTFFQMEDLTHGMQQPCIMDVKIGKRTWDPLASPHKRAVEEKKYVQCKQVLGICLPGFQVYNEKGDIKKYDRDYGKQLDVEGCREAIRNFLNSQHKVCRPLVQELLRQLYDIRLWFREQKLYHFYASSLLIVYDYDQLQKRLQQSEGQATAPECLHCRCAPHHQHQQHNGVPNGNHKTYIENIKDSLEEHVVEDDTHIPKSPNNAYRIPGECTCLHRFIKIRMIDFAHVFPASNGSLDTNYLFGLESLISILEDLLH
uniref:Kinase n=1 Tax=Stomoxys calcitrans TaxID=35570 RepID=A0A1I8NS05_STOCA